MRAGKSVLLGRALAALYLCVSDRSARESLGILRRIEGHMDQSGRSANHGPEAP